MLQLVESQFDKIEKEVRSEVQKKLRFAKKDQVKAEGTQSVKSRMVLEKAEKVRKQESKQKLTQVKQNQNNINPPVVKTISFNEHIESQKENNPPEFKFEVMEKKFQSQSPIVINKTNNQK